MSHPAAREGPAAELVLAADQFIVRPSSRAEDEARARADGGEARTVIAGYHWFTDWGRDTINEIFDAEPPFTPRGCVAQAWSVAEILRSLVRTHG